MKQLKIISFFAGILMCLNVSADEVGNGGDGVLYDKKPYLLDLIEAGVYQNPYFKNQEQFSVPVRDALVDHIEIDEATAQLVSAKMLEIFEKNYVFEMLIKRMVFRYDWVFVDEPLINISDEDMVLEFPGHQLVQLAVRKGSRITIKTQC